MVRELQVQFLASFTYAFNSAPERAPLWEEITKTSSSATQAPWILLGDFNVVRFSSKKVGGDRSWPPYMEEFNKCCFDAHVEDLRFSGHLHIWSNRSPGDCLIA